MPKPRAKEILSSWPTWAAAAECSEIDNGVVGSWEREAGGPGSKQGQGAPQNPFRDDRQSNDTPF
jgi:hypothetical protein